MKLFCEADWKYNQVQKIPHLKTAVKVRQKKNCVTEIDAESSRLNRKWWEAQDSNKKKFLEIRQPFRNTQEISHILQIKKKPQRHINIFIKPPFIIQL